ncbi:2-amino-4-hydroxy-6-hydroxymethyldihydropteridine diphosphokinase [Alcanivorax sediminis]|uniref:2-amino-4-hydroxy-6-hydroxymethyldihydropteridine pyrophosphokinase n=1 Tax=Alcanivorax sediminis TaxID=2663008 RepID=A0A6N7LNL4_9GAMM|nr:2-amino-4-hydroxy-6-hydroxymethyldihydropteridine diphosphokinase [Alcanivorax sediminis]MQX51637.1 2-amino-4-hydroxy-6-hydroxymethyldihydropteridine diphosphokinase [Alcanivorax sediminis]
MQAFIGLGSNLDQPAQRLISALCALQRMPGLQLLHHSRLYRSAPIGPQDQPDYVNAVALVRFAGAAHDLLHTLQALELAGGRQRLRHWGERTLDLDILLIDDQCINTPDLQVPHPQMVNRAFVLQPLLEISPHALLPDGTPLGSFLEQVREQRLSPLEELDCDALIE